MIKTAPSLTGFMRAEVKKQKEQNQSGAKDYSSQNTIIQEDEAVNHGYSEEFMSGSGQQQQTEDDIGTGGGLPMRLPTEIMNTPPPEEPAQSNEEYTETMQQNDEVNQEQEQNNNKNDQTEQQQQEQLEPAEVEKEEENDTVRIKSLESEYAALDMEMAQQYYYLTDDQYKMGPFTMEEITEKYKSEDVNDETLIWSGNETNADAKPLKQNERIYSNLPKPPKRRQPQEKKIEEQQEEHEVVASRSPSPAPQMQEDSKTAAKKSGGCCLVM